MISQVGHLPFYFSDPRCEVVAISESRSSLVEILGRQYRTARIVPQHRAILDDPRIVAVVIVAPRASMAPLALEALEAGKHVMMEKPMAHTAAQAAELVAAAEAADVSLAVGFMKRYDRDRRSAAHLCRVANRPAPRQSAAGALLRFLQELCRAAPRTHPPKGKPVRTICGMAAVAGMAGRDRIANHMRGSSTPGAMTSIS